MFQFINKILEQFLPCFNRQASWDRATSFNFAEQNIMQKIVAE
jgi:hypothetical protein